jgi:hypothetical protein
MQFTAEIFQDRTQLQKFGIGVLEVIRTRPSKFKQQRMREIVVGKLPAYRIGPVSTALGKVSESITHPESRSLVGNNQELCDFSI